MRRRRFCAELTQKRWTVARRGRTVRGRSRYRDPREKRESLRRCNAGGSRTPQQSREIRPGGKGVQARSRQTRSRPVQPENPRPLFLPARAAWPATAVPGQPGAHLGPAQAAYATAEMHDGPADGSEADPARSLETIPDAEPTPGSDLLDELRSQIAQFVIPPSSEALNAVTLWVVATQLQPAWQHAPRLAVVGPAKRCGKSRLLDVLTETVHEPMLTINTTPAAIFRSINEEEPPTLLVDEADTIFGPKVAEKNEETRGLLNMRPPARPVRHPGRRQRPHPAQVRHLRHGGHRGHR